MPSPKPLANDRALELALLDLGVRERARDQHEAIIAAEIAEIQAAADPKRRKLAARIEHLQQQIADYAKEHRDRLLGSKKSTKMGGKTFGWRAGSVSVVIADAKAALAELKEHGMRRFIRISEAPDKTAIKKKPADVQNLEHVSIEEGEESFYIK